MLAAHHNSSVLQAYCKSHGSVPAAKGLQTHISLGVEM